MFQDSGGGSEVGEKFEPGGLAFLGMELHATDRTAAANGRISDPIFSNTENVGGVVSFYVVGVHEIEVGPVVDPVEERVIARSFNLVPARSQLPWGMSRNG